MENDTLKSVIINLIIYAKPLYRLEKILNTIATAVDIVILLPTNTFVHYLFCMVKRIN